MKQLHANRNILVFAFAMVCACSQDNRGSHSTSSSQEPSRTAEPVPKPSPNEAVSQPSPEKQILKILDGANSADLTFYNPESSKEGEGGANDFFDERVVSMEDAIREGRLVTIAADSTGKFGQRCVLRNSRCTILIIVKGFDKIFPSYHPRFPNLPKNGFIGIIEDRGDAFSGTAGKRFDIPVRSSLSDSTPGHFGENAVWFELENPCGRGSKGRKCNLAKASIDPLIYANARPR